MMKLTDGKSSSCLAGNTIHRQILEKKPKKMHREKSNAAPWKKQWCKNLTGCFWKHTAARIMHIT
jgi:hypothetical protein